MTEINKDNYLTIASANPNFAIIKDAESVGDIPVYATITDLCAGRDKNGKKIFFAESNPKFKKDVAWTPERWAERGIYEYDASTIANNSIAGTRLGLNRVYFDIDIKDRRDSGKEKVVLDALFTIQVLKEAGTEIDFKNLPSVESLTQEQKDRISKLSEAINKARDYEGLPLNGRCSIIATYDDNVDTSFKGTNLSFKLKYFINSAKGSELELRSNPKSMVFTSQLGDREKAKDPYKTVHIINDVVIYNEFLMWCYENIHKQGDEKEQTESKSKSKGARIIPDLSDYVDRVKVIVDKAYDKSKEIGVPLWNPNSDVRRELRNEILDEFNAMHGTTCKEDSSMIDAINNSMGNNLKFQYQSQETVSPPDGKFMCAIPLLIFFKDPYGWNEFNQASYKPAENIRNDMFFKHAMEKLERTILSKYEEEVFDSGALKGQKKCRYNPSLKGIKTPYFMHPKSGKIFGKFTDPIQNKTISYEYGSGYFREHDKGSSTRQFEEFIQDMTGDSKFKIKDGIADSASGHYNLVRIGTKRPGIINDIAIPDSSLETFNFARPSETQKILWGDTNLGDDFEFPITIMRAISHLFSPHTTDLKYPYSEEDLKKIHLHNPHLNLYLTILAEKSRQSLRDLVYSITGPQRIGKDAILIKIARLLYPESFVSLATMEPLTATHSSDIIDSCITYLGDVKINIRDIDMYNAAIKNSTGNDFNRKNAKHQQPCLVYNNCQFWFALNGANPLLENDMRLQQTSVSGGVRTVNGRVMSDDKCLAEVDWVEKLEFIDNDGVRLTNVDALQSIMKKEVKHFAQYLHNLYIKDTPKLPTRRMFVPTPKDILQQMNSTRSMYRSLCGLIRSAQRSINTPDYDVFMEELVNKLHHSSLFNLPNHMLVKQLTANGFNSKGETPTYSGLLFNYLSIDLLAHLLNITEFPTQSQQIPNKNLYTAHRLEERMVLDYVRFQKDNEGNCKLHYNSKYVELPELRDRVFKKLKIPQDKGELIIKMALGKTEFNGSILDVKEDNISENKEAAKGAAAADEAIQAILRDL